jgi:hypothetical protein
LGIRVTRFIRLSRQTHTRLINLTLYEGKFKWHIQHLAAQSDQQMVLQHQFNISHQQVASTISIEAGANYVILATAQGGPASAVTLVLPEVTSGTFAPGYYPSDATLRRYPRCCLQPRCYISSRTKRLRYTTSK